MVALKCSCCGGRIEPAVLPGYDRCWHCGTLFVREDEEEYLDPGLYYEERTETGEIKERISARQLPAFYQLGFITRMDAIHRLTEAGYTRWTACCMLAARDFRKGVERAQEGGNP